MKLRFKIDKNLSYQQRAREKQKNKYPPEGLGVSSLTHWISQDSLGY